MGMPITVEIVGAERAAKSIAAVFKYFRQVDERFSPYKADSELSKVNRDLLDESKWSAEMKEVMQLCAETKGISGGYFDIKRPDGKLDPSGLVKGWSIAKATELLIAAGIKNFYIEAGGDIQTAGLNLEGEPWLIGIRNPKRPEQIVKRVRLSDAAIATSGLYIRGDHIYNPLDDYATPHDVASLSVIAPNIFEADRFATAAFAMGAAGINFLANLPGGLFEAYQIDHNGIATLTKGFIRYVA